jgi:effector-binding domain-containing protein
MFRIGEFSRLSQVSIKTLRYYDEIDLFKPSEVDRFTAYRAYSAGQLPRLNRILVLKDLGFSLEQIRQVLDGDLHAAELRGMLRLKQAEVQQQLAEETARLQRIEARIIQIEREGMIMSEYEVIVKEAPAQAIISIREVIPDYGAVGRLYEELGAALQKLHLSPSGPAISIYYDGDYRERDVDVEAAFPLNGLSTMPAGVSRARIYELPGMPVIASVIHRGPNEKVGEAYSVLMKWLEQNGYDICGPSREIYLHHEHANTQANVVEVQFPIKRRANGEETNKA